MATKKVLRPKKSFYFLIAFIVFLVALLFLGIKLIKKYQYQQTLEYKVLSHGYSIEAFKIFESKMSDEEITKLLERDKNDLIVSFASEEYFLYKNLDSYIEYKNKERENDLTKVVQIINVHANNKWYQVTYETDTSKNEKMLVNKFYKLKEDYVPENLTVIPLSYAYGAEGDNRIVDYAYEQMVNLFEEASKHNIKLMVNSSYRSYKDQEETYNYYKNNYGEKKADLIAAKPGHSEHQTGLVIDVTSISASASDDFKNSNDYKWLKENAHNYGFIERYPEGKTYLTGYEPESWHWRYVGKEIATKMYEDDITFDEYYAYYIEKNTSES